jgi:hypothetical protein
VTSLQPVIFNIYIDEVIQKWQKKLNQNIPKSTMKLMVLFADNQVIAKIEENLQKAVYRLTKRVKEYNLCKSTNNTKAMDFTGKCPVK